MQKKSAFLFFGLTPALFFQVVGAYFYFELWPMQTAGKVTYFITKILLLIWPFFWWKFCTSSIKILPTKKLRDVFYGLGTGIPLSFALFLIFLTLPSKELLTTQIQSKAELYLNLNLSLYIAFSIFLSFCHSLLEEYYWRWFLGKGLEGTFSKWTSILLANLAFSAHHFIVLNNFLDTPLAIVGTGAVFSAGVIWSLLYEKTHSLFSSWISHACVDITIMAITYTLLF